MTELKESKKRNILTVFIASPGDLMKERSEIRSVVDRINKVLGRRINWQIELMGWEDTLPSFNRPQDAINKDVALCDLFIGMLWKRWGSQSGKYESGFEEEFELVRNRKKKENQPEIWLLFKEIGQEAKTDPGEQLKKVLAFRDTQIQIRELLFKNFSEENFKDLIYDDLLAYVTDLSMRESEKFQKLDEEVNETSKSTMELINTENSLEPKGLPLDILELFERLNHSINVQTGEIGFWDKTRLYLTASSLYSKAHSHDVLDNHVINVIFHKRNEWTLSSDEELLVLRSIISDQQNLKPGWCWLKDYGEEKLRDLLVWFSLNDPNIDIRKNSISKLTQLGILPNEEVIKKWFQDDTKVILEALNLLKTLGTEKHLILLEIIDANYPLDVQDLSHATFLEILYRKDPNEALRRALEINSKVPDSLKKSLENRAIIFPEEMVLKAFEEGNLSLRRSAFNYLSKSGKLDKSACFKMLNDSDSIIRKEVLIKLIEFGEDVNLEFCGKLFPEQKQTSLLGLSIYGSVAAEDFLPYIYGNFSNELLLEQVDFFKSNRDTAYRILSTKRFNIIEDRIRKDLDEEFESLKQESIAKLRNLYGDKSNLILESWSPSLIDFIKENLIGAALEGLAVNGQQDDIKYARRYLGRKNPNLQEPALRIIEKFGDESDVESLLIFGKEAFGEMKIRFIKQAYHLSTNKEKIIESLLDEEDLEIAREAALYLAKFETVASIMEGKAILSHKDEKIRLIGLAILIKHLSEEELFTVLDNYINGDTYYYNIVSWLDKILYTVSPIRERFKNKLLSETLV